MAGKNRLIQAIRRQAYYKPMLDELARNGIEDYEIVPPTGRGHPMLVFEMNSTRARIPLPGSPTGFSAAIRYVPANIRQWIKEHGQ